MKTMLILVAVVSALSGANYVEHHYTREDCVVIQDCDKCITFEDKNGHRWDMYDENNEFQVGDIADLKMHDNNTIDNIKDDEIVKVLHK